MAGKRNGIDPRLELLEKIKAAFDADAQSFLNLTANLNSKDVQLIGTVIQLYCYADFNGRRLVDALRHAATGKPRTASRLQDAQVFPALEQLADEHLWECDLRNGLLNATKTLQMHHIHRHNFAHWAARRVKGENALILFTSNAREAERREGNPQEPGEAKYAIVPLDDFHAEVEKLQGHANYLSQSAALVETNLDDFRAEFERLKKEKKAAAKGK